MILIKFDLVSLYVAHQSGMWDRFDIGVACEQTFPGSSGVLVLSPTPVPQRTQESMLAG